MSLKHPYMAYGYYVYWRYKNKSNSMWQHWQSDVFRTLKAAKNHILRQLQYTSAELFEYGILKSTKTSGTETDIHIFRKN